ncbi:hypothetical protein [Kitasatospora sp. NPDC056731]|uniref:hypothetical protein n=1 Tax=Kitasatospora sp. NPDC056731 TaxID=3155422 RepID=UPI00342DD2C1
MDDAHIVGVHGIWQGSSGTTERLSAIWQKALTKGIRNASGPHAPVPALAVPSYSHLFPKQFLRLGPDDMPGEDTPLTADEEEFVEHALSLYLPDSAADDADQAADAGTLGRSVFSRRIEGKITAVDRTTARGAGSRLVWFLREVHGYLRNADKAEQVRAVVRETITTTQPQILIAHSLGSVIAYDMIQRGEISVARDGGVRAFITCGSPLGWLVVRDGIAAAASPLTVPAGTVWTNAYSRWDVVARGTGLGHITTGVTDVCISTGNYLSPHGIREYLTKRPVADAVTVGP